MGRASLLIDIASEMIFPLLPTFLITVLGGNHFHLGVIEGVATSVANFLAPSPPLLALLQRLSSANLVDYGL